MLPQASGNLDEREAKRLRRKQSNRESARRSRLRKQAECEQLARQVKDLITGGLVVAGGGGVCACGRETWWALGRWQVYGILMFGAVGVGGGCCAEVRSRWVHSRIGVRPCTEGRLTGARAQIFLLLAWLVCRECTAEGGEAPAGRPD